MRTAIKRAADTAGESFTKLSQQAAVFEKLSANGDTFTATIQNIAQRLSTMGPQLTEAFATAGDRITTSLLNVQEALVKIQQTKLDASNLQVMQQQIALQGQQLQLQAQTFSIQKQQLSLQGAQRRIVLLKSSCSCSIPVSSSIFKRVKPGLLFRTRKPTYRN